MNNLSVIDQFLAVFSQYIDSGFGLLHGEVAFLTATLVVIDMTLAGLFWAMGGEDIIGKLIRKTLYVGAFAFIIGNFNTLSGILFKSFAGLGLVASGSTLTQAQLLQPGQLAKVGVDAARPILIQISSLTGFPEVFANLDTIAVLGLAWLVVIVFFVLAVQLFVTLIEFKLTTLAGFVLVPFALWNKTAFLAERVLGNVVSSGIKVLVLAVIVGIGTGLFAQFQTPPGTEPSIDLALTIMLASLAMLGLNCHRSGVRCTAARCRCGGRHGAGCGGSGGGRGCGTRDRKCRGGGGCAHGAGCNTRRPRRSGIGRACEQRDGQRREVCLPGGCCGFRVGGCSRCRGWPRQCGQERCRRGRPARLGRCESGQGSRGELRRGGRCACGGRQRYRIGRSHAPCGRARLGQPNATQTAGEPCSHHGGAHPALR